MLLEQREDLRLGNIVLNISLFLLTTNGASHSLFSDSQSILFTFSQDSAAAPFLLLFFMISQ